MAAWYRVKFISKFAQFKDFPAEMEEGSESWRRWFDEQRPESKPCPAGSLAKLKVKKEETKKIYLVKKGETQSSPHHLFSFLFLLSSSSSSLFSSSLLL